MRGGGAVKSDENDNRKNVLLLSLTANSIAHTMAIPVHRKHFLRPAGYPPPLLPTVSYVI